MFYPRLDFLVFHTNPDQEFTSRMTVILTHLSNLVHKNTSVGVSHCYLSPSMSPSDPVEGRATLHYNASGGHLKQQQRRMSEEERRCSCMCNRTALEEEPYFCVVVQVPQVQVTDAVHTRKQSRVSGRPHDVIHVVRVVLKRV